MGAGLGALGGLLGRGLGHERLQQIQPTASSPSAYAAGKHYAPISNASGNDPANGFASTYPASVANAGKPKTIAANAGSCAPRSGVSHDAKSWSGWLADPCNRSGWAACA